MRRLVHLSLTKRALLLLAPGAVQVLKSGTECLNAEPIGVLAQTLTRQRVHLVDTLGGLHRRRRVTLCTVTDALTVATLTCTLNPGGTKKRTGCMGGTITLSTAQHAERRGVHLLLTRGGERAGRRRLRDRPRVQRGQQGSVDSARLQGHENQRRNRCGKLRLQATLQGLQILLMLHARQAMHAHARHHSQSLQETIGALLISAFSTRQQNVHRTRIARHQLHQVGAQMCLLQLQVVPESRGGQRQVVGHILLLQSAQREVAAAQVGLAGTAPEHNSRVGGIMQGRGARNRQVACGRQGEGTFLFLLSRLMSLLRCGTVLRPTAKEMQKHQQ